MSKRSVRDMRVLGHASRAVTTAIKLSDEVTLVPSATARGVLAVAGSEVERRAQVELRSSLFWGLCALVWTIILAAAGWLYDLERGAWSFSSLPMWGLSFVRMWAGFSLNRAAVALAGRDDD